MAFFKLLFEQDRDINKEAKYPETILPSDYKYMYEREGLAKRVVTLFPDECWKVDPIIYDDDDEETETEFEEAWKNLVKKKNLYHYLHKADRLSGIGSFGIILIGLDDGKKLEEKVDGVDLKTGEATGTPTEKEIIFLRVFDESLVQINSFITDETSPLYGYPEFYNIKMDDSTVGTTTVLRDVKVHWTRIIHIADECDSSEIFGTPRQRPVFNRILDVRKIMAGAAESMWKLGFPGLQMKTQKGTDAPEVDVEATKAQLELYMNSMQRYIIGDGMEANLLNGQPTDPTNHFMLCVDYIALTIGVPKRVFIGSEEGQLASGQDKGTWNERLMHRQDKHISPNILRKFADRCIAYGVLPSPKDDEYQADWPDLTSPSKTEKIDIGSKMMEMIVKYLSSGASELIPPMEFLTLLLDMDQETALAVLEAAEQYIIDNPPPEPEPQQPVKVGAQERLVDPKDGKELVKPVPQPKPPVVGVKK